MPKPPNQKTITIHKAKEPQNKIYSIFYREAMEAAMRDMNGREASGFMLWCYLSLNQDGFELGLSYEAVHKATGIKQDAYNTGVRLLREKGYLVLRSGSTVFDFYQVPKKG